MEVQETKMGDHPPPKSPTTHVILPTTTHYPLDGLWMVGGTTHGRWVFPPLGGLGGGVSSHGWWVVPPIFSPAVEA